MAVIKCKMCGGDIEISADKTFGTCEYCGSTMTLPRVDDEQRAAAFNRGNHFRRSGEFDKALAVYERIVAEDDNDAEAHWCCALCRFGIEYVEDPATYEWLPTCHRASFDSFLEDVDYLAAVEHSDGITRRQYQKDAAKIAEVQRGILATSQNEQPFDVFLCYKETGEDGQRTRDSLMAQEVYYELTEQGYRVFFARITLEDKAGTEYEPYIFAALNSAKVMVVIGTKPEHFNAVWVKNEWSRFLSMMKKDRSKLLLPCYRDMDPYDLPEALSVLQSYADAEALLTNNDFDGAIEGFKKISGYKDADKRVVEASYQKADSLQSAGNDKAAAIAFGKLAGYKDSRERSITLWNSITEYPTIATGRRHTVGIRADGTVAAIGENDDGQCGTSAFSDIIAVAAGNFHTVGLRADGTVVSCGKTTNKQCDVSSWENIVSIAVGGNHTVGLKIDGTVVATGSNNCGQLNVSSWSDVVAISASISHTVGLTASGKVVAVGSNNDEQLQVSVWDNITAIAAGTRHTVGLKSDGTVVAVGNNTDGRCDVSDWTDIVAIAAGTNFTAGLKSDGTVVATSVPEGSMYYYGQNNVTAFTDIVEIAANGYQSIGLKSDGTVVATGNNDKVMISQTETSAFN